ncbi:thiazole biosynthesis adenylyltransferase ThiF [Bacillaceae bacterium SIJ1]|uniref:ThiF family adenylyltransferase n=1 Tax=Litoribacterium kuwaitense TaxID=1398745 RepID=UPI0013EBD697|nr:ThiF family adenylyltransferase [Litoribacterium kuwaitense]NGP43557.1 thiazole biosynthesis adenylyltransferase ThiF [Litoribacterium kuwaitense]
MTSQRRYSRQTLFAPIGQEGQEKLLQSSVLIVGMGALGTATASHFVRAGVGHVRFVDRDFVEWSNLQRQQLFDEEDARQLLPKAQAAELKLKQINSSIHVEGIIADVSAENLPSFLEGMDVIVDGTDNFETRFLLNEASVKYGIPYAYGGVVSSRSLAAFFEPGKTPCLRCLISGGTSSETCDTAGVISPAVTLTTSWQAASTLKYLVDAKEERPGMMSCDIWTGQSHFFPYAKPKEQCPTCQKKQFPLLNGAERTTSVMCGRDSVQLHYEDAFQLDKVATQLSPFGEVKKTPFLVRAHLDDDITFVIFPDGRVLIQGTTDSARARSLYSRFIGN